MIHLEFSYIGAAFSYSACPESSFPEFAIIGRSNVGKSSLINALAGRKKMARTSKSPGKTRALHFYQVSKDFVLVDLPGYGYAKVPLSERNRWDKLASDYLTQRDQLMEVLLLVDSRHEPTKLDKQMISWLLAQSIPFSIIATKMDKISSAKQHGTLMKMKKQIKILQTQPQIIPFSSITGQGKKELFRYLKGKAVTYGKSIE